MREFISEYLIVLLAVIGLAFVLGIFLKLLYGPDTPMAQAILTYVRSLVR